MRYGLALALLVILIVGCQSDFNLNNGQSIEANVQRIDKCLWELSFELRRTNQMIARLKATLGRLHK